MAIPTYEELLQKEFAAKKAEVASLIADIAEAATSQYVALSALLPDLQELAEKFGEKVVFTVPKSAMLPLKQNVISFLASSVSEKAEVAGPKG